MRPQESPGLSLKVLEVDAGTSTFDLTLNMTEQTTGLLRRSSTTPTSSTAPLSSGWSDISEALLTAAVASPDTKIGLLPLLSEEERRRALVEWNVGCRGIRPAHALRSRVPVHRLIEERAAVEPDAVAVVAAPAGGTSFTSRMTYRELDHRANQLAHALRKRGVGPESIVAISAEKSVEMIVGLLGILKAGGAYLPIDPSYPGDRVRHMLRDSGATLLLTQARVLRTLAPGPGPCGGDSFGFGTSFAWIRTGRRLPASRPPHPMWKFGPDNLAYVIYTSGLHRPIEGRDGRAPQPRQRVPGLGGGLCAAGAGQDPSADGELFVRRLHRRPGARPVLGWHARPRPRELLLQPDKLYALMRRQAVTCAEFVPGVLRPLIQYLEETGQKLDFMEVLACGSDSWYMGEYRRFLRFCGPGTPG